MKNGNTQNGTRTTREPAAALDALARKVIGAAIEVHRELGPGLPESAYEKSLALELASAGIRAIRQSRFEIKYKGHSVGYGRLDLLVDDALIVELKAVEALTEDHTAQVVSYLRATKRELGLLINFNVRLLKHGVERVVLS